MTERIPVQSRQHEALVFKGRFLPELPRHYTEPSQNNSLIVPHGAMPANPFFDDQVKRQQLDIKLEHLKLYLSPPIDMPASFVKVVADDYIMNEPRREMENFETHMKFISEDGYVANEALEAEMQLYEKGQASISQIADVLVGTNEVAGEFGKVGHPFGYRMQHVQPMRADMDQAIEVHDGVVYPAVSPYRSIVILPKIAKNEDEMVVGPQRIDGFIVKYKRDYGKIPVPGSTEIINVVERQIAAFRVDEASGFDQEVLAAMHQLSDHHPDRVNWEGRQSPAFLDRLARTGCKEFIERAIQRDSLEDFVVPVSTTLYGYKSPDPIFANMGNSALRRLPVEDKTVAYYGPAHSTEKLPLELEG